MTLLQMTYILEVERCGSMNRAARNLFVSQSALSAAIAEVERELGITAFRRSNRGIDLTQEGRELIAQIAPLVEGSRQLTRYYSQRRAEDRVTLSVASQRYPFCAMAFVEYLHLLEEPHIQVSFKEMEMAAVIDEVARRQSALGILFLSDATEHFITRLLREKGLTFHPLAAIRPRGDSASSPPVPVAAQPAGTGWYVACPAAVRDARKKRCAGRSPAAKASISARRLLARSPARRMASRTARMPS